MTPSLLQITENSTKTVPRALKWANKIQNAHRGYKGGPFGGYLLNKFALKSVPMNPFRPKELFCRHTRLCLGQNAPCCSKRPQSTSKCVKVRSKVPKAFKRVQNASKWSQLPPIQSIRGAPHKGQSALKCPWS